jgi:uncharacterized protein
LKVVSVMARSPFLVNVAAFRRSTGTRRHERRRGRVPGLEVTGSRVPPGGLVEVDVVLDATDGGIAVGGTVFAPWEGDCRRCLTEVTGELEVEVHELYQAHHRTDPAPEDEEETYLLTGDVLDLEPLARDAVLLSLPLAPLCRPDCAGLCPACGADLNAGPCGCPPATTDPRWAGLEVLRGRDLS